MTSHLQGLTPEDLLRLSEDVGIPLDITQARRFLAHELSHVPGTVPPLQLSRRLRRLVEEHTCWTRLEVLERSEDPVDHFVKYLFRSPDGALTEAVRIPLHKPGRFSVCLSSQVGCAMKCAFCATGRLGWSRNLEPWEMVDAFLQVRDEAPGRVTGAVFMGQGEPFHNYEAVIQAARVLSHPCGGRISMPAVTISTVGLVPQIRRFAREKHRFRLIVSLTSAIAEKRAGLLPIAGKFSLEELADALREYSRVAKGRITVAWVVLGGVNTGPEEALALKELLGDLRLRINLIDVNDGRPDGFRRATDGELSTFRDRLQILGVPIVRRYSGGSTRDAACGMLVGKATGAC